MPADQAACGGPAPGAPPASACGNRGGSAGLLRRVRGLCRHGLPGRGGGLGAGPLIGWGGRLVRGAAVGNGSTPTRGQERARTVHGQGGQDHDEGHARHRAGTPGQPRHGRNDAGSRNDRHGQGRRQHHRHADGQTGRGGNEAAGQVQQGRRNEQRRQKVAPAGHGESFPEVVVVSRPGVAERLGCRRGGRTGVGVLSYPQAVMR